MAKKFAQNEFTDAVEILRFRFELYPNQRGIFIPDNYYGFIR
jgi:hypothetical protein